MHPKLSVEREEEEEEKALRDCYREKPRYILHTLDSVFSLPLPLLLPPLMNYNVQDIILGKRSGIDARETDALARALISELVFARGLTARREVGRKGAFNPFYDTSVVPCSVSIKRNSRETHTLADGIENFPGRV